MVSLTLRYLLESDEQLNPYTAYMQRQAQPFHRRSRGWERVADWRPCALGAQPSGIDRNGCVPAFQVAQDIATEASVPSKQHASPMAFALQSAHPSQGAQQPGGQDLVILESVSSEFNDRVLDEHVAWNGNADTAYVNYWQRFQAFQVDTAVPTSPVHVHRLMPGRKLVKLL